MCYQSSPISTLRSSPPLILRTADTLIFIRVVVEVNRSALAPCTALDANSGLQGFLTGWMVLVPRHLHTDFLVVSLDPVQCFLSGSVGKTSAARISHMEQCGIGSVVIERLSRALLSTWDFHHTCNIHESLRCVPLNLVTGDGCSGWSAKPATRLTPVGRLPQAKVFASRL